MTETMTQDIKDLAKYFDWDENSEQIREIKALLFHARSQALKEAEEAIAPSDEFRKTGADNDFDAGWDDGYDTKTQEALAALRDLKETKNHD